MIHKKQLILYYKQIVLLYHYLEVWNPVAFIV